MKNVVKTAVWVALLAGFAAAQLKYVAVVETELDEQSDAPAKITRAEVRQITAELRRQAVNNLPAHDKYNIMTSETVIAQGGTLLEECSEENCVIILGAKIGADFIVKGIVSTFGPKLALIVEIYETENGNLVASSEPVRSEKIEELLEMAAASCAEMYKTFANAQARAEAARAAQTAQPPPLEQPPLAAPAPEQPKPQIAAEPQAPKLKRSFWIGLSADITGAGLLAYGVYQNGNVTKYKDAVYENIEEYNNAKKSVTSRNIGYTIGSILLFSGISVHIFF